MEPNAGQSEAPESKPGSKPDAKNDLKSLPMPEVEKRLGASPAGLTQAEVERRLAHYGYNEISEKKTNPFRKYLNNLRGPIRGCSKRVDGAEELKVKSRRQGTNE
jgi:H+-transporting ATPase